jgi:ADP-heptose:LPS heptosyltransferase
MFWTNFGTMLIELPGWLHQRANYARTVTLVRYRKALGDTLMLSALARGVKRADPSLRLEIACRRPELFLHNPNVDEVRGWHLWRTRWTARPGYHAADMRSLEHVMEMQWWRLWTLLRENGYPVPFGQVPAHAGVHPELFLTEAETAAGRAQREALAGNKPLVLMASGGKRRPTHNREWGLVNYQAVADCLAPHAAVAQVAGAGRLQQDGRPVADLRGRPVREVAALFVAADALLLQEGGLHHLARAVNAPAVVIFGGAVLPGQTGYPEQVNLWNRTECSPCLAERRNCPHLKCMAPITPRRVLGCLGDLLAKRGFTLPGAAVEAAPGRWTKEEAPRAPDGDPQGTTAPRES